MARGIPSSKGKGDIAPLPVKRIDRAPIDRIAAFRMIAEKKDDKTGDEYEVDQVNLSIDFNSGHIQRNEDGEPVLDRNENEQIHYINEGYVTLSGDYRAKLVKILRAAGFDGPEFIDEKGNLTDDAAEEIEVEFGKNGLGHDYAGRDWDDLPYYTLPSKGGKEAKRDVEVPVTSFKIKGYELIGREVELALEVKNGYNKPTAFIEPRDAAPLGQAPAAAPARGIPASNQEPEDPFEDDEPPFVTGPAAPVVPTKEEHGKGPVYVWKIMEDANIAPERRVSIARHIVSDPSIKSIAEIPNEHAQTIRDMYKADASILVRAHSDVFKDDGPDDDDEEF